jgi:hypothetical protein
LLLGSTAPSLTSQERSTRITPPASVPVEEGGEQRGSLRGRGDPIAPAANARKTKLLGRIDGDDAIFDRTPVDHAERHERVPDRARVEPLGEEPVGERLEVGAVDLGQPERAEVVEYAEGEDRLVAANHRRLVRVARACPYAAVLHPRDQRVRRFSRGRRCRRAHGAAAERADRVRPPSLRGRERALAAEGLADLLSVPLRVDEPGLRLPSRRVTL